MTTQHTPINIDELERLARAAGPWFTPDGACEVADCEPNLAAYIEAVHPKAILQLIKLVREREAEKAWEQINH